MKKVGMQNFSTRVIQKPGDESASFDQAIALTGYGRYNRTLFLVCGLIIIAFGFQFGLSSYILPSAQCDLKLSSTQMGLLNAGFLIGTAVGGIPSGAIADSIGRRKILIWSLLIDGCATLLSSLSQNFSVLFMFRCVNGLAVGGPSTIINSFLGEFHASKSRSKIICYAGFFWSVSRILLPGLAWIVIPLKFNIVVYGFTFNSWRLFIAIIGFPSFIGAFLLTKYPETPKFLLSQGQNSKALEVMHKIFASNTKQKAKYYPVKMLISGYSMSPLEVNTLSATLKKIRGQLCGVFSPPLGKYTILLAIIQFTNLFGNYGLGMWLPELFNRFEVYYKSHPNTSISVCQLAYLLQEEDRPIDKGVFSALSNDDTFDYTKGIGSHFLNTTVVPLSTNQTIDTCDSSVDAQVFINTMIIGFCCLLGNLASGYLANRWENRIVPIVSMLIPGMCGCIIYFLQSSMQNLIASCIFTAFLLVADIAFYSVIIDVFPTNFSAIASAVASVAAGLGAILSNILFGLLLDVSCEVPIFLIGGVVIFGGLLGFLLPTKPLVVPNQPKNPNSGSNVNP